jgi:hypothetical protein
MKFSKLLLTTLCLLGALSAWAQHFKQITGSLAQIAAGRNEVFGLDSKSQIWRFNGSEFVQIPGLLKQVAVGGGTLLQKDEIWGVNASGAIHRFNHSTKAFTQIPGILAQIAVGEGDQDKCHPYEVWGTNKVNQIYRYNYCTSQFEQFSCCLARVATGGGDVWGINSSNQIYHYSFSGQTFEQVQGTLAQIAVGVNDVWGLNSSFQMYRYDPESGNFVSVAGQALLGGIADGGDGVWGADAGFIFRFDPSSESFTQVQYNSKEPAVQIAVGSGAGVWVIDSLDQVFTFVRP